MEALMKEDILTAFWKTGVSPFNPDIITAEMMAPSVSSSSQARVPLQVPSLIRVIEDMIHRELAQLEVEESAGGQSGGSTINPEHTKSVVSTPVQVAVSELSRTSSSFLLTQSPPKAKSQHPRYQPSTISPFKATHYQHLLEEHPTTHLENELQKALVEAEGQDNQWKHTMIGMQASVILDDVYVDKVQRHLQAKESQKVKGK